MTSRRVYILTSAKTNKSKPVVFQPPFVWFITGQMGLFVQNAYFATLLATSPIVHDITRASNFAGSWRSRHQVPTQPAQPSHTARLTAPSLYSGVVIVKASRPARPMSPKLE